jgi:thioredoxin reductase
MNEQMSQDIIKVDVLIVGAGPAGLAAAIAAKEAGTDNLLVLERELSPGGILRQCIHNGFGLHRFKEELTGPEYAQRDIDRALELNIPVQCGTTVLSVEEDHTVTAISREHGLQVFHAGAIILAMGCRERPRGALNIPGYRPSGIFTAGTAQYFVNMEGLMPGKEAVILGSGDIGLIMARRMTLEGAKVKMVVELMPYSGGLKRNIVQCLDDYGIPLKLNHTIIDIDGKDRLKGVTVAKVDENRKPIKGAEDYVTCDTLLLSVGLIPENELSKGAGVTINPVTSGPVVDESLETNLDGVFACGNVLHVHDLVDYVSGEASLAGRNAAGYIKALTVRKDSSEEIQTIEIAPAAGIRYTVPQLIHPGEMEETLVIRFRVDHIYKDSCICVFFDDHEAFRYKKKILSPGEMQEITLKKKDLPSDKDINRIVIKIED